MSVVTAHKFLAKTQTALVLQFQPSTDLSMCSCCGKPTTHWLDWSSTYRNVICPNCDSQPRHRLLSLYLKERTNLYSEPLKVLHFAPESSWRKTFASLPNLNYTTADLYDSSVDVKIDITKIPYPDNTFDIIFCSHVLEHVPDDATAMRELFRVLKSDGWAFLQVPIDKKRPQTFEDPNIISPEDRLRYYLQEDHVRLYGLDYKQKLEQAGFTVKVEKYAQELSQELVEKYGIHRGEDLYFGLKPR